MSLWDGAKESAAKAGQSAMLATQKTVIQGEILLLDREITNRKRSFGVQLYDHVQLFTTRPEFYSSDDLLTTTLRPPLLKAQREIAALEIKRGKFREEISQAENARKNAFPTPANTWYEKMMNAGKMAAMAGNEAKLSAELSMVEVQMREYKEIFGLELYGALVELEDERNWLPTDREIRSLYDNARRDVEKAEEKKKKKERDVEELSRGVVVGNSGNGSYLVPDPVVGNSGNAVSSPPPPGKGGGYGASVPSTQSVSASVGSGGYGAGGGYGYGGGGSGAANTQAPPPGKGGGYGASVPCPPPASASSLGGGYGTSTTTTTQAYNLGGGNSSSTYGSSYTDNQTSTYGSSYTDKQATTNTASFYGDDYDSSTTPVATPVAAPVAAAAAAPPAAAAGNNSSFSFITPEADPFAGLSAGNTQGSFLGSSTGTSGTTSSASSITSGAGVMNQNTSNTGATISDLFAGITGPSSTSSTSTDQNGGANLGGTSSSIGGAIMKASLKNPKAAASAFSVASSLSSSLKF